MKKTLFILAIALCGAGVLSAQSMKGFVSGGNTGGIDVSFGMPVADITTTNDYIVSVEKPFSQLEEVTIDTTVLGGTDYDDGYFAFHPVTMADSGTHKTYKKLVAPKNLDVLATLHLNVLPCGPGDTVTDANGNKYATVPVAGYCWTKENLRTTSNSSVAYNENADNALIYGLLYPWYDAVDVDPDGSEEPTTHQVNGVDYVQGICPDGWHIPTEEEFDALSTVNTQDLRATTLWTDPHSGENTNSSGFTALPAGKYNNDLTRFEGLGTETSWWSTTFYTSGSGIITSAKVYICAWYCSTNIESIIPIKDKVSVRCVKEY